VALRFGNLCMDHKNPIRDACKQTNKQTNQTAVAGYQTAVAGYQTAVAGYQTACTRRRLLPCCSGKIPNCMHAAAAAVALLQWQDTKLHARLAALLQWQVLNLLHRVKDEQTCNNNNNNNNNKARCIPTELCNLSRVKIASVW
jgi:hypothetical protein